MSARLPLATDYIKAHQNPDGGWGYEPGRTSLVEPTGLCVLALHARGDVAGAGRGLAFLKKCLKPSGAMGLDPRDGEGSWMAYAALLAFHALGASEEDRHLRGWALTFEDASGRFTKNELATVAARYRYDASIPGWAWTPRTTAWVEPTALFVLALICIGVPVAEKRIQSGIDLILDRKVPSGGWNFGNPFSKSFELEATAMSTALALAALGAAGIPEGHPAVAAGLLFLEKSQAGEASTATLAWSVLALKSFQGAGVQARDAANRLAGLQAGDGGFRGNLFETALSFLVLGGASILDPASRRPR
jgi:hypothetical protein